MLGLQIITAVLASVAITLTLWQFLARHRPFVGVSDGRSVLQPKSISSDLEITGVQLTLKNWGESQANNIWIEYSFLAPGAVQIGSPLEESGEQLPLLFPTQEVRFACIVLRPFSVQGSIFYLRVVLNYRAPLSFKVGPIRYGRYRHVMLIFLPNTEEGSWGMVTQPTLLERYRGSQNLQ